MTDSQIISGEPSPSPFHASHQFAWDSTSLGWYKECPRKYQYSMLMGLRTKSEHVNLTFGIWYHQGIERYEHNRASGMEYEDALLATVEFLLTATWINHAPWQSDHPTKTRYSLLRSIIWYIEHFRDDPCETIILGNGKPAVELSFRFDAGEGLLLCGHLDRLVSFNGSHYVLDHKTSGSTISAYYFNQYKPDNQMTLYTLAGNVVYQAAISGVIIDAAQIAVGFTRFSRGFTYRTESELNEWLDDTRYHVEASWRNADAGYYPMNDKSCHKYSGCQFREVCSSSPTARRNIIANDFIVKHWNPLEIR